MKRILTSIVMATLFASICLLASSMTMAQTEQATESVKEAESPESTTCPPAQTFTSGSGESKFAFCITDHGNVQNLEFPATFKHISNKEGYVACTEVNTPHGFDAGVAEDGWGPAVAAQPNGPHTFPLSITRDSTDGVMQLKQTFEWESARKDGILITMTLKNISAADLSKVVLSRYFDGDINSTPNDDAYRAGYESVWAYEDQSNITRALRLTSVSYATPHASFAEIYTRWNPNGTGGQSARRCFPTLIAQPSTAHDYVGRIVYYLETIKAGQSKTVKVTYGRL
jgi:hypothetical protein